MPFPRSGGRLVRSAVDLWKQRAVPTHSPEDIVALFVHTDPASVTRPDLDLLHQHLRSRSLNVPRETLLDLQEVLLSDVQSFPNPMFVSALGVLAKLLGVTWAPSTILAPLNRMSVANASPFELITLLELGLELDGSRDRAHRLHTSECLTPLQQAKLGYLLTDQALIDHISADTAPAAVIPHVFCFFATCGKPVPSRWLERATQVGNTLTPTQAQLALWALLSQSKESGLAARLAANANLGEWRNVAMKHQCALAIDSEHTIPYPIRIPQVAVGRKSAVLEKLERSHGSIERNLKSGNYIFDARLPNGSLVLINTGDKRFPIFANFVSQPFIQIEALDV